MKIVLAADSFKGSNSSRNVGEALKRGMERIYPTAEYLIIPIADGGEGTTEAVLEAAGGELRSFTVTSPLGETVDAGIGILPGNRGVIEMAAASGLPLVPEDKRDPSKTTTRGTGELIKAALDAGCREIMIGIGGSATNDCGVGMAQALGIRFLDASGAEIGPGGGELARLESIDPSGLDSRIGETTIHVACDVNNPLWGPKGASATYGPQKGADPEMVELLDKALKRCAGIMKRDLGKEVGDIPGSGAAGGLGAGLVGFLDGKLEKGIDAVLTILRFEQLIAGADLVITGEGKLDYQTAYGKVPAGVATWAKRVGGIPVIAVVGDIGEGFEAVHDVGIDAVISSVNRAMPLAEAMGNSTRLLEETGERVARLLQIGSRLKG